MTTGRINQVTILTGAPSKRCHGTPRTPGNRSKNVSRLGCAHKAERPTKGIAVAWSCQQIYGHPIAPTEIHKEWSAPGLTPGPRRPSATCDMYSSKEGFQLPVTSRKTATGFGRPSIKVSNNDSHRPFIHRPPLSPQLRYLRDFGHSKFTENPAS